MKRWMSGWMMAGAMMLGTAALAQDTTSSTQSQTQDKSVANDSSASPTPSAGESKAEQQDTATGGSGQQQKMDHSQHGSDMKADTSAASSDPNATAKKLIGEDEKGFMQRMHFANKTEVELSKLALEKSQNKDVKKLAQMLVDDHTKADQQLTQMAQKANVTLDDSAPSPANDTERAVMDAKKAKKAELQALEGTAFDQAWLTGMVGSHDMTLAKNMAALEQFQSNKELSQMLTQLAPKLMKHREMAYDALGKAKPSMRQARSAGANR